MDKKIQIYGGGEEGEEWIRCTVKVMLPEKKWWRHMKADKVFTDIREAIDNIG